MNENYNKGFIIIVVFVFILPFIAFLLTSYSIYLKEKMSNLKVNIIDLKSSITSEDINIQNSKMEEIEIKLPKIEFKPNTSNIELQEVNYYNLLQKSTNTLYQNNIGAVKIFDTQQNLLENTVEAYEKNIPYYIFINNDKYYLYRKDFEAEEQKMYSVQLYLYFDQAPAYLPAITLRKSGLPVYILNSYTQSNNEYFAIMVGLFEEYAEAFEYLKNMDEDKFQNLTGLSIKDRFLKSITFYPKKDLK